MRSRTLLLVIAALVACIVLAGAFSSGIVVGRVLAPHSALKSTPTPIPDLASTPTVDPTTELFAPFWQAWKIVHDNYVDQPVDDVVMMRGAIKGMLEALGDQHTSYMDPFEYKDFTSTYIEGEYEGIGAWVSTDKEYLTITNPMPGSPAEKAGLQPGDQIIAIDGNDMTGIDPELVRRKVLGPKDSKVVLTILREGTDKSFDVEITRASIQVPSVTSQMLDGNVAYVQIYTFGDKTTSELRKALRDLIAQKPVGLILDLRNNGGGLLQTAIEVVSEFIGNGVVMYEEYGDGRRITYDALPGGLGTEVPMVVLVNKWTASASEIVAGAIQDYGRGLLVGEKTFGKGSVQSSTPLTNDQGAVRVTIARWLTPEERQIHQKGLTPDVEVALTDDDIKADKDPQLDKAVELLTQK